MSRFFIDRPVFAWVIAILLMLGGALSIRGLPVSQYPDVAPPAVGISINYPGASAATAEDSVTQVIEQQLNGLDGLRYISSESLSTGNITIVATFEQGTDPDIAQVQVQNKLQLAMPMLPEEVQRQGVRVAKHKPGFMLVLALVSQDGRLSSADLGDFVVSTLRDPIARTTGVGDFMVMGAPYAMRIWLDPARLHSYDLMPQDVISAIRSQNVQVSSGQFGGLPAHDKVRLTATVVGKVRMKTAEEFENILLKVDASGAQVRLSDVADVVLGSENFSISSHYWGKPAAAMGLKLASGANMLDTVAAVKDTLERMEPYLPEGVEVVYPFDTSPVVAASIEGVVHTLIEAVVLVFLVMLLFLQNLRATIIPTLAVPVVLMATFGVMFALGFTINVMTMFAMVLAIGLLVDDAIVVVENVERIMSEEGLSPKEATRKSMDQIQSALVGIGLVISAVFMPMAFFGGSTGVIYQQFAITIISAMSFSVLVALFFTPALCATILKPVERGEAHSKLRFFRWFNTRFDRGAQRYRSCVNFVLARRGRFILAYLLICGLAAWVYHVLPSAFLPEEDQSVMVVQVQLPGNSTAAQTEEVVAKLRHYFEENEPDTVRSVHAVIGFNFAGRGQSSANVFVSLKSFEERPEASQSIFAVAERANAYFSTLREGRVFAIVPPSIIELGTASGFDIYLKDNAGLGREVLDQAMGQFLGMAAQEPSLTMVRPNGPPYEAQYQVIIDDERARALQVSLDDINNTLSAAWGSTYVNDFIDRGRSKKVYVQGVWSSRMSPEDLDKWYVRNADGGMVPFSAFASGEWTYGSPKLQRFGGLPAIQILGAAAPGYTSGDAMAAVERIAQTLPSGISMEYSGLSYEERASGSQAGMLYVLSVLIVFLCLAALYESWSVPFAVILVVPLGILGALVATWLRGLNNDVYFQVGMLTTMGLAAKNAILIIEFARSQYEQEGKPLLQATADAARLRLRPIIMTSLAFVFGVLPLAVASGASSGSQHAIGTGVVGGTIAATLLAIFFVPLFYVVVVKLVARLKGDDAREAAEHA